MRNVTRIGIIKKLIVFIFFNHKTKKNDKKSTFLIQVIKIRPVLKNGKKRAKKLKKSKKIKKEVSKNVAIYIRIIYWSKYITNLICNYISWKKR